MGKVEEFLKLVRLFILTYSPGGGGRELKGEGLSKGDSYWFIAQISVIIKTTGKLGLNYIKEDETSYTKGIFIYFLYKRYLKSYGIGKM